MLCYNWKEQGFLGKVSFGFPRKRHLFPSVIFLGIWLRVCFLSCGLLVINKATSVVLGVEWCDKALNLALVAGICLLTAGACFCLFVFAKSKHLYLTNPAFGVCHFFG